MKISARSLSRSFSQPNVSRPPQVIRGVVVEQIFQNGTPTLIRQFSYEHIFHKKFVTNSYDLNVFTSSPYNDGFINHNSIETDLSSITQVDNTSQNQFNDSPMDVDLSNERFNKETFELRNNKCSVDGNLMTHRNIKRDNKIAYKKNSDLKETSTKLTYYKSSYTKSKIGLLLFIFLCIFVACIGCLLYYDDFFLFFDQETRLQNVKYELENNIVSQNNPIIIITKTIEQMRSWSKDIKVLGFIGSTGVGKTYMANLIKKNFNIKLLHEINSNQLKDYNKQKEITDNIKYCCYNLIIIDDLIATDYTDMYNFIKSLPDNKRILVIAIFNIQETVNGTDHTINYDKATLIRNSFAESDFYFELAYFEVLDYDKIKSWIERELHKRHVDVGDHNQIIQYVLQNIDVKYNGFKGLYKRLNYIVDNLKLH